MKEFYYRHSDGFLITGIGLAFMALLFTVTFGITRYDRSLDQRACSRFGEVSNREVRFVDFNWASWDCLTPQPNDKWISTDRLREDDSE